MGIIPIMAQTDLNALKELLAAAAVVPAVSSFIIGMLVLFFVARLINNSMKPVMALVSASNENFREVLEASEQTIKRGDERIVKHEEAMSLALETNQKMSTAVESVSGNLVGITQAVDALVHGQESALREHEQRAADRNAEILRRIQEMTSSRDMALNTVNIKLDDAMGLIKNLGREVRNSRLTAPQLNEMLVEFQTANQRIAESIELLRGLKRSTQEIKAVVAGEKVIEGATGKEAPPA